MRQESPNPLENQAKRREIGYINTLNSHLRSVFGKKMVKLSLDGGFTCPNRDGTKGFGGCSFCSEGGSGENASSIGGPSSAGSNAAMDIADSVGGPSSACSSATMDIASSVGGPSSACSSATMDIASSIENQIALLSAKWKDPGYIAYFQSFTNTYAPVKELRQKYDGAIADPRIEGLAVSTRPDCLPLEVLDLLEEYNSRTYFWVELGLQSSNPKTMEDMNLCYTLEDYDRAAELLKQRSIPFVTHILLGLPGESRDDMVRSVAYAVKSGSSGLKFHLFNLLKGTALAEEMPHYESFSSPSEYINLAADLLELVPQNIVMHRLSADAPLSILISPKWAYRKKLILDGIRNELVSRGSYQGFRCQL